MRLERGGMPLRAAPDRIGKQGMKLILFDVDGTLVDSQHMIYAAMARAYRDHGLACPPADEVRSIIGLSLQEAFRRLAAETDHPIDSLVASYGKAFFALRESGEVASPLFPGARETIGRLMRRPDLALGIATGKSRRGIAAILEQYDLKDAFVTIQTADSAPSKPHPGMVLQAMRESGIGAASTAVVGDTVFDMQMARAAGAAGIGVAWGYHPVAELRAAGARAVVDNFSALESMLDGLWPPMPPGNATLENETTSDA